MSSLSLPWRRRPSALFIPGAWPHTSASTQNLLLSPREPQSPTSDEEGDKDWRFATKLERLPFEDHIGVGLGCAVASVARRHIQEIHSPAFSSPEIEPPPLSASFSLDSNFTDAASEVMTPDLPYPQHVPWIDATDVYPGHSRYYDLGSLSPAPWDEPEPTSSTASPSAVTGARNLHISSFESHRSNHSYLSLDAPRVPHLSLQSSQFSLGYATALSFPEDSDAEDPPPPPLPRSRTSSIPSSFNIPCPDTEDPDRTVDQESVALAMDFYPVPSNAASVEDLPSSRSSFVSSRSSVRNPLDSPILPAQDKLRRFSAQTVSPSAADLDAFALAAIEASQSSLSIPTSLHSASPSGYEPSSCTTREAPLALLPSAATSSCVVPKNRSVCIMADCDYRESCECGFDYDPEAHSGTRKRQGRRRARPMPVTRASITRSISSRVDVGMSEGAASRHGRKNSAVLGKMKKFGGKLLGWFKLTKAGGDPREKVDVQTTTTTALTAVEYRSDHPASSPRPRSLLRPLSGLISPSSSPQEERRNSFHPFDADSRPVISLPRALSKGSAKEPRDRSRRASVVQDTPQRPPRARTQTAPPGQLARELESTASARPSNARRLSLSSALTLQRLEGARAVVEPRPALSLLCPPTPEFSPASPISAVSSTHARCAYGVNAEAGPLAPAFSEPTNAIIAKPQKNHRGGLLPHPLGLPGATPPPSPDHLQAGSPQIAHAASQPNTPTQVQSKPPSRSRGFSLSSAISKRALRARSMIVSVNRRDENTSPGSPRSPRRNLSRRSMAPTVPVEGVQFDIVSPPCPPVVPSQSTPRTPRPRPSAKASAEPPSDIRSERVASISDISFANTRGMSSSTSFSSFEFGLGSDTTASGSFLHARSATFGLRESEVRDARSMDIVRLEDDVPVKALELSPNESFAFGATSFATQPDELDRLELAERSEDQSFMRALGLEFDEIAKRASRCL